MEEQQIIQIQKHFMMLQGVESPEQLDVMKVVGKHQIVIDSALREVTVSKQGSLTIGPEVSFKITYSQLKQAMMDAVEHGQGLMSYTMMGGKGTKQPTAEEFTTNYIGSTNWNK